jgi:hypothetical protein
VSDQQQQQILGVVWEINRKIDDLEDRIKKIERTVTSTDINTANTGNVVKDIQRRIR